MSKRRIFAGILLALVVIVFGVTSAVAEPTALEVEVVECTVEIIEPGREWIDEDLVYHLRGRIEKKAHVSDYAFLNGIDIVEINLNLDLTDGSGDGFGSGNFQPDGMNGTFIGRWTGEFNGGVLTGRSVTHGTGELLPMRGEATFGPLANPSEALCDGWDPMYFAGVITDPLGRNLE